MGSSGEEREMEPCFNRAPTWVRTFYWVPVLGSLARRWLDRHDAFRPAEPPPIGEPGDGDDGVREPRRPRPFAGAGAVALEEPIEDTDEDLDEGFGATYGGGRLGGPASPTSAA